MTQEELGRELTAEAVLFAMGRSVELRQLAAAMECGPEEARAAVEGLKTRYDAEGRALKIIALEDCYQMCTRSEYHEALIRVVKTPRKQVLTDAVMETLSIIAYRQPVTRTEIEKIRGVSSDYAVNKLIEYGLVYEAGRLDVPGKPAVFATTEEFLRRFGVPSRRELPELDKDREAEIIQEAVKEIDYRPEDGELPAEMQAAAGEEAPASTDAEPEMAAKTPEEESAEPTDAKPEDAQETGNAADTAGENIQ